ncbi:MAG: sigma-70 family RNA polymerase sigma factor [Chloroflexi bacterium]|nr:sigma-70 family RNA polymerase sigma factor [Chloroflexota bacterium]
MLSHPSRVEDLATIAEQDLIQRAQDRDELALSYIYEKNHERIYRYILARVGKPEDAEDLTAEVFLKMLNSLGGFSWRGITLSAWLFRIAHNITVDHLRRRNSRAGQVSLEPNIQDTEVDPSAEVEKALALQEVATAVRRLTPAQQEVIALRFAGGLSVAETARVLKKNEGTVKVLQYNAIAALRRIMGGRTKEKER